MELFKLLGTIAVENNDANKAIDDTTDKAEGAKGKMSGAFSKIGQGAVAVGKTIGAGLAVGATAMTALTTKALNLSGELEQNMGGSEAVFKDYAGKMQDTAKTAFSNMGLSTSDFLGTANKMGALFQGAGFSIQESSDLSASAMQRAADVASIMGISTEDAMEAVAGAAKGNFTMMDNLGVAMNDTAIQNYALSNGINKTTAEMTQQEKIGLAMEMFMDKTAYAAGNYAKENETLAGSLGTAKSALSNFLDGSGSVEDVVSSFSNAGSVIVKNLNELVPKLVSGITQLVEQIVPMLPPLLQSLLPGVIDGAVQLINGLVAALPMIVDALMTALPGLIEGVVQILLALSAALINSLPMVLPALIEGVIQLVAGLAQGLPQIIQLLVDKLPEIIISIVTALAENLPILIEGLMQLMLGIVQAYPQIIQAIIDALPQIITLVIQALIQNLPLLIEGLIQLVAGIVVAIPQIIMALIQAIPTIIMSILQGFAPLGESLKALATNIMEGVKDVFVNIWNAIQGVITTVVNAIKSVISSVFGAIKSIIDTVLTGIKATFTNIWNAIESTVSNVIDGVKNTISNGLDSAKNTVSNVLNGIKDTFSNIFESAKNIVSSAIENIKGFFNFSWSLPKLEMPHFSMSGSFSLNPPSIPHIGVEWYKKAMDEPYMFTDPTLFDYNPVTGTARGAGEAGDEMMYGRGNLMNDIGKSVAVQNGGIVQVIEDMFNKLFDILEIYFPEFTKSLVLDTGVLVAETAEQYDDALGIIKKRKERG